MKKLLTIACLYVVTTVAIVSFITAPTVFGQEKKTANVNSPPLDSLTARVANKPSLEGLDEFIVEQMKEWNVPGLAIAIVRDGSDQPCDWYPDGRRYQ